MEQMVEQTTVIKDTQINLQKLINDTKAETAKLIADNKEISDEQRRSHDELLQLITAVKDAPGPSCIERTKAQSSIFVPPPASIASPDGDSADTFIISSPE